MSQAINIPIHFNFIRTPCTWEIRSVTLSGSRTGARSKSLRMLFPKVDFRRGDLMQKPHFLNGWECRLEFFKLGQNEDALVDFLSRVGVWQEGRVGAHAPYVFVPPFVYHASEEIIQLCREGQPPPVPVEAMWEFRKSLGDFLVNRKRFIKTRTPARPQPRTGFEALFPPGDLTKFDLSFVLEEHPEGVVTVTDARHMLLTTVYVDVIRGLGFKYCRRHDCKAPFALTNNHEKFYCSQHCAHLENVRKKRREAREAKRKVAGH
jgi:hypothetical protein